MFTKEKKVESKVNGWKPRNRLLRLFRSNDVSSGSLVSLESTSREDVYSGNSKALGNAMLEADYQNARALLAFERNERFQ